MYVTVNIAFNYMSQKNGGLRLYPGSHKLGNLEAEKRKAIEKKTENLEIRLKIFYQ